MGHKNIFSDHVSIGMNEYVLNIVMNIDESFYLVISESEPSDGRLDHKRIRIPIENARGLRDALNKSISKIDKINRMKLISRSRVLDLVRNSSTTNTRTSSADRNVENTNISNSKPKESHIHKQRKIYPKAYMPWTAEDDSKLEDLYCEGCSVRILAQVFERNIGAINSRIDKLELREKYG
ncbi:hypothetical protein [Sphingobacterium tabacisoli]|uniref:Uncharacterized protein n=1 Tax=Sphingobacterium tabacisoli TaxID=2044855 RepID=A0ABW5L073_9SPHI|nr:hypothetical protein [Sphingobacterium tabacisoli]